MVQCDDQRAERKWTHKVSCDDVEALGVRPGSLLLQPFLQTLPITEGQRPQGLLQVLGDVIPVSRQVKATDEEALCQKKKGKKVQLSMLMRKHQNDRKDVGQSVNSTWTSQVFFAVQVTDHVLCGALVGPPVGDGRP